MEIKKGTKIYTEGGMFNSIFYFGEVVRLTPKQAVLDNGKKIWRDNVAKDGEVRIVGAYDSYLRQRYYVGTPEIMDKMRMQKEREDKVVARTRVIDRIGEHLRDLKVYEAINKILDEYDGE